jgi:4-hydroxy-3-polyprenylbenzoate decarboxylase
VGVDFEAGFHNLLVVSVENRYAKEGMKTALGLMGTGQLSLTKAIVLVDGDVDPRDRRQVFEAIARHFNPAEDFLLVPGVPLDTLDFTGGRMNLGSKMVIDAQSHARPVGSSGGSATAAMPAAALLTELPDPRTFDARILDWRLAWGGMLVVQVRGEGHSVVEALIRRPEYANVKLVATVSEDVPLDDDDLLLWGVFTRFDCARDVIPSRTERAAHGPCAAGRSGSTPRSRAAIPIRSRTYPRSSSAWTVGGARDAALERHPLADDRHARSRAGDATLFLAPGDRGAVGVVQMDGTAHARAPWPSRTRTAPAIRR